MGDRYDPTEVLAGLKDFQRATVDYVFRRMYQDADSATRFLVADEVGLGKTMVARGLIARAVRHLQQQGVERVDVIYVCSNVNIAAQNIRRLRLPGFESFERATRLTLLPLELHGLSRNSLNFVAFTPGTSFNLRSSMGTAKERALLHVMLSKVWGPKLLNTSGAIRVLQGWVSRRDTFEWHIGWVKRQPLERELVDRFADAIEGADRAANRAGAPGLQERFVELAGRFRYPKKHRPAADTDDRSALVGELRQVLARTCIDALEPDLVILDEFQRFRNLLDSDDPASDLARAIFDYGEVRTLLLSATPYKMYSLNDEQDDDHYRDFLRTVRFLMGDDTDRFADELDEFRQALYDIGEQDGRNRAVAAKTRIERRLRAVMARTERLAVDADRNGMLAERPAPAVCLEPQDLAAFVETQRISDVLGAGNVTEYWKSAPYLLNFMDRYRLVQLFDNLDRRSAEWRQIEPVLRSGTGLVPWEDFERYRAIDPQNARLRSLLADTVDRGAWKLLWIPPAMPYYEPGSPFDDPGLAAFTKRLVFSAWTVVPKVVASLVSYEAERRMMASGSRRLRNTPEAYQQMKPLLQFKKSRGRLSGLSTLPLIYPSPTLAMVGDPLHIAGEAGAGTRLPSSIRVRREAQRRIGQILAPHVARQPTDGPVDKRWYWAAPILLDLAHGSDAWLDQEDAASRWVGDADDGDTGAERTAFADALDHAVAVVRGQKVDHEGRRLKPLGRVPDDLATVMADVALAAPGVAALRALARGGGPVEDHETRDAAAKVAWGFRSMFNAPETTAMIRGIYKTHAYWRRVLRYCVNGNLQAVLDEYVHVVRDWLGIVDGEYRKEVESIAGEMSRAATLRTVRYRAEDRLEQRAYRLRARFALRFGNERSDDDKELQRASAVRAAFNSPFWPFVLASTSIGQEGLDFHLYCHAVVHWNLPGNPVDLEQREGRVHRYKGHAVRKNVAATHRTPAFQVDGGDPWEAAFAIAAAGRAAHENDLVPFWVFPGDAKIERYTPNLPLSREVARLENLKRSLTLYRLVFGQPRQEDLIEFLLSRGLDDRQVARLVEDLRVDLQPPGS